MKKYMFELQAYKRIEVEADSIEEARDIACFDPRYKEIETDYVSDGQLIEDIPTFSEMKGILKK